jgi:hypothetical protein
MRPQLAVAAVLAAGGFLAGGYFLWPKPRHLADACAPVHAPVPTAARAALAAYAGRIRHDVEQMPRGVREETWQDPLTNRTRTIELTNGHLTSASGAVPDGAFERNVLVLYDGRRWMSRRIRLPAPTHVANGAAETARLNRDLVARGLAKVAGEAVVGGRRLLVLRQRPRSIASGQTFRVDVLVDPLTYVTVRTRLSVGGHSSTTDETWLPRTRESVAATRIVVPTGFRKASLNGSSDTFTLAATSHCAS